MHFCIDFLIKYTYIIGFFFLPFPVCIPAVVLSLCTKNIYHHFLVDNQKKKTIRGDGENHSKIK